MKRFLYMAALLAALVPSAAHARWIQREIGWQYSQQGSCGTCTDIAVRDTIRRVLGGAPDTTNEFSPDEATVPPRGLMASNAGGGGAGWVFGNPGGTDSTVVGFLVCQSDTTAGSPSNGLGTVTVVIEGRAAGLGTPVSLARGWVVVDSLVITHPASDEALVVPIRTIGTRNGRSPLMYSFLRARSLQAVGGFQAARVFWRYWKAD